MLPFPTAEGGEEVQLRFLGIHSVATGRLGTWGGAPHASVSRELNGSGWVGAGTSCWLRINTGQT